MIPTSSDKERMILEVDMRRIYHKWDGEERRKIGAYLFLALLVLAACAYLIVWIARH